MRSTVLNWPRSVKRAAVVSLDVFLALFATWGAYSLRQEVLHWPAGSEWWVYLSGPLIAVPVFARLGLYRAIFRYTGMHALMATGKAVLIYTVIHLVYLQWYWWPVFPITLGVLQPILFLLLVGLSRALARYWLAGVRFGGPVRDQGRLLIYGAGHVGVQTSSAIGFSHDMKLLGFVDDDDTKVGQTINGIPVFAAGNVTEVVSELGITDILLALPSITRERRNAIIQSLRSLPVHTRTLPALSDLASGRVTVQDFKELEIEDLLGREVVRPRSEMFARTLTGQIVMVTGAAGSIGSELCRQILKESPRQLLLLEHSEFGLYTLHRELQAWCTAQQSTTELVPLLASVRDRPRLDRICTSYRPQTVFHAAAYKHVPMVECNPSEGMFNNVFGTLNMAQAALQARVARFVLVSTDKAVRPTNLMGASKRMAELVLQALADNVGSAGTCFSMVRFGNVLGSSGSVVPLFRDQLARGGPLTITHPEVTRYFMTIPEAAQLVLQAGAMAQGGEVFVLEMGQPVKIIDLARQLVELSGLQVRDASNPTGDIEFSFVGLRPGEKLYEELLIGDNPTPTEHPRIMKAREAFMTWEALEKQLIALKTAGDGENLPDIKRVLEACVSGFCHQVEHK